MASVGVQVREMSLEEPVVDFIKLRSPSGNVAGAIEGAFEVSWTLY